MKDKLISAIQELTEKSSSAKMGIEAQQYAQAVLNLSNALIGLNCNSIW